MTDSNGKKVAVLGAGSWGTALAILLARNGWQVSLWGHHPDAVAELEKTRVNARYLPGITFPDSLTPEADLGTCVKGVVDILVVVPSHGFRETLTHLAPHLSSATRLVWATKGLEPDSGKLLHEVAREVLPPAVSMAVISGPTFAREVAEGMPTAITAASRDEKFAATLAAQLHNPSFRVYTTDDTIGVEVGGAVKNVFAIAAGISDGLGFGANARSALITRGLTEMMRFGVALGARRETFMGLAGIGDLVLTCTDDQSRNRRMGLALGKGLSQEEALRQIGQVVEGVRTAREVYNRARGMNIDMPIVEQVCAVLFEQRAPQDAVHELLNREQKAESLD
jgi:glycerol-3-phosphate dehydrogenase (NAD(P)+)